MAARALARRGYIAGLPILRGIQSCRMVQFGPLVHRSFWVAMEPKRVAQ
jgi:hypothetical protein